MGKRKSIEELEAERKELEKIADMLQWPVELVIVKVENDYAKRGRASGTISIANRPVLNEFYQLIKAGKVGALLVVDVGRLSRDQDLIDPAILAQACKIADTCIITSADSYIYDFRHPTRDDLGKFTDEAKEAARFIKRHVKGKMLKTRTDKANSGNVANGIAPVGLMLNETRDQLVRSPHAERVDWLYARFRAHGASLSALLHEVVNMAKRGEPLFSDAYAIEPNSMKLARVPGGWTISSYYGLRYILSNPVYQGHLVFNGRIVKYNAHEAIVDADNWQYAFDRLAELDLDGKPMERETKQVRYTQQGNINNALLAGTRDNGTLVLVGVGGKHIYLHTSNGTYTIRQRNALSVNGYDLSITMLDTIFEDRLLHWLNASEKSMKRNPDLYDGTSPYRNASPYQTMGKIDQAEVPTSTIADELETARQKLADVQRRISTSIDVMSDHAQRETYASENRLINRIANLEQAQAQEGRLAMKREQAKRDIDSASEKWAGWSMEERRQFIKLVTESITLEEIADGWLTLTCIWSPLAGFISPLTSNIRAVEIAYIWRPSGSYWNDQDINTLIAHYPHATRSDLLHMFPSRSWLAIMQKAIKSGIHRLAGSDPLPVPNDTSLSDVHVLREFGLTREHVQWQHHLLVLSVSNPIFLT